METKVRKKVGVWIDQNQAILVTYNTEQATFLEKIESPIESRVRIPGRTSSKTIWGHNYAPSNNEYRTNNTRQEQVKKYFSILENKLGGYDEILLFGPGIFKNRFFKEISSNKGFSNVKVHAMDADKMTSNQLLAFVRNHFS